MNNLLFAARPLVSDFLPTIVFAALIAFHVDVRVATGAALLVGVAQLLVQRLRGQKIAQLQWASLGLVVVFGTLGILTNDPRFLMAKPTIIYVAIGAVMLKRGWMLRYLPPIAQGRAEPMMIRFGYVWSGLMFVTALANLAVAVALPKLWPAFIAVVPMASKIALFAVQYATIRFFTKRQMLAEMAQAPQSLAA